jgi:hypothetical protein
MSNEEVLYIISTWTVERLDQYIIELEERIENTRTLIAEVRRVKKSKQRKKPVDAGKRGG